MGVNHTKPQIHNGTNHKIYSFPWPICYRCYSGLIDQREHLPLSDESGDYVNKMTVGDNRPVAEKALAQLRQLLENGVLLPGGQLPPERELTAVLGVGRRSLRQALDQLEVEGLIWRRQGQGTFATAVSPQNSQRLIDISARTSPAELLEFRIGLEPMCARYCSLRATSRQIERLAEMIERSTMTSTTAFENWDVMFHRLIAEGAGNTIFQAAFNSVSVIYRGRDWRATRQATLSASQLDEIIAEHTEIVCAIVARNPDAAEQAMRNHLTAVYRRWFAL